MHRLRAHYQWLRAARLVRQRCRVSGGLVGGTPLCSRLRCAAPGHFDFSEAWSWVACLGRRSRVISLALGPKPLGVHRLEAIWWPRAARLLGSDVCPPVLLVGRLEFVRDVRFAYRRYWRSFQIGVAASLAEASACFLLRISRSSQADFRPHRSSHVAGFPTL